MKISIKRAHLRDSDELTRISFAAKRYWKYPESYFDIWAKELTVDKDYIEKNTVYVAVSGDEILGYYSLVQIQKSFWVRGLFINKGLWLDHLFIRPGYIGHTIGTKLMAHARVESRNLGYEKVLVLADPNSKGFYEKMGLQYIEEVPSNIEGRAVSYFEWNI